MGVSGLLGLLKSIQKPCNLKQFAGQTIGVDAYGWLHRGAIPCAIDLALGKPTTKVVDFCMHRVRMLVHFGVTPYLVFDGDRLPSKAGTEKSRRDRRKESREAGMELLKMGKTALAHQELQKAVDITPEMARMLIEELKRNNVEYVVAPYEADSQLAYLEKKGIIDGVLSEDSDLLVFGVKTLLTKLDQYGDCIMVKQDDFTACRDVNLVGWTVDDFRRMAILSGCDYLEGIHKMGLKTAHRLIRKYKTVEKVIRCAQLEGKFKIPSGYFDRFTQAEQTFLYQWVFCPQSQRMVNLTEPESESQLDGIEYIGRYVEPEMARKLAAGDLNPMTKQPIIVAAPTPQYKRTPLLQRSKTLDDGKSKKIDTFFFKSQRTPLAELDPNSFTPSPSQQRTLAANANRTWDANHPDDRPSSAPSRVMQHRPALLERTNSAPNPNKRQRLCGDDESAGPAGPAATERSRFFRTSSYQPSPLGAKGVSKSKGKHQEFNMWSDDSMEDAMAALPDVSTISESTPSASAVAKIRKFSVFADDTRSTPSATAQANLRAQEMSPDITSMPIDGQGRQGDGPSNEAVDPFAAALYQKAGSLADRFSNSSQQTPSLTNTQSSRDGTSFMAEPVTPPRSQHIQCTVVEFGSFSKASAIAETPSKLPIRDVVTESPHKARSRTPTTLLISAHTATDLPEPNLATRLLQHSPAKGSEDLMIIPDSEGDFEEVNAEEEADDEEGIGSTVPVTFLDLKRFEFAGDSI